MVIQLDSDCHFLTWIDNFLIAGNEDRVKASKEQINQRFDCDDVGELTKYVGCKTDRTKNSIKFTQPVLLQSIEDEFGYVGSKMKMWAEAGSVLVRNEQKSILEGVHYKYHSCVGKLLHIMHNGHALRSSMLFMNYQDSCQVEHYRHT